MEACVGLDVRDLRLVRAITQEGTLTRAGNALFLTQSALSRQLADLERRLGVTLFQRTGRRMSPTPAGERLLESGREILGAIERAEADVRDAGEVRALLRFATECYTVYHWLPRLLTEFRRRCPDVEPRIVASATRRPIQALLKGQLDVAIVSSRVRDQRLRVTPLFEDEFVAVVATSHPWAGRAYVTAEDFADEHLLLYTMSRKESTLFQQVLDPVGVTPQRVSRVELTEAILELVRAGLGVGALASWAVAPCVRSGALATVRIGRKGIYRQWSAAVVDRKETAEHLERFVALLAELEWPADAGAQWVPS